jgi:hypothetical protein
MYAKVCYKEPSHYLSRMIEDNHYVSQSGKRCFRAAINIQDLSFTKMDVNHLTVMFRKATLKFIGFAITELLITLGTEFTAFRAINVLFPIQFLL